MLSILESDNGTLGQPVPGSAGGSIGVLPGSAGGSIAGGRSPVAGGVAGRVQVAGRTVFLEITGTVARHLYLFINEESWIRDALAARGWDVRAVNKTGSWAVPGVGHRTYLVEAVVGQQYSDSQVVHNARMHLTAQGMVVANVRLFRAAAVAYLDATFAETSGGDGSQAPGLSAAVSNFALGLGLSSPIVIAGGVLVLYLILRK